MHATQPKPASVANVATMPEMTDAEAAAFLDEPGHLLRIGTVDDDGQPLVVPIWFMRSADRLLFTPRARSAWLGHLRSNPRAGCTIDEAGGAMRKVVARGEVTVVHDLGDDDAWRDVYRAITMRYVPEHWGESYLNDTHDEPRALLSLSLTDARVSRWRMPTADEDQLAVWAPRYYHDDRG
jgi:nitroimidazol reductase NimA-like FMN-containing flavoprotein (pyridoxamine 5'-phosphate oxidase superfamily)